MRQLTTLILIFTSISTFAQQQYSPEFLIPYNDNGKWGWSDTLGNLKVGGDFKEVHFFYERYQHPNEFEAYITTEAGENRYAFQKGLLVPLKYNVIKDLYQEPTSKNRWIVIQDVSKKIGLYDGQNQKLIVDTKWEKYYYEDQWKTEIYFSGTGEKTYWGYNFKTKKYYKTQIDSSFHMSFITLVDGKKYTDYETVFHQTNGRYTRFINGTQKELTKEEMKNLGQRFNNSFSAPGNDSDNPFTNGAGKFDATMADRTTGIVYEIDYSRYQNSPFKKLIVKSQNSKVGIVTETGDTILPFVYDKIYAKNSNLEFHTYQNGKIGLKLLYSIYPVIEPKYERLERSHHNLPVNSNWIFQFYEVRINGKSGLIGENGVEYFHFD